MQSNRVFLMIISAIIGVAAIYGIIRWMGWSPDTSTPPTTPAVVQPSVPAQVLPDEALAPQEEPPRTDPVKDPQDLDEYGKPRQNKFN